MKKIKNSYKKSGVNISLANKLVSHLSILSKKNDQKRNNAFNGENIGGFGSLYDISNLKIKDPGIRIEQDIAYNEGLVQDIQKDIDKSEQKKKEIEHTLEIYRNISKKIKIKNKDIRTIQQLRYNISKIKKKELKKKLMDMLRR